MKQIIEMAVSCLLAALLYMSFVYLRGSGFEHAVQQKQFHGLSNSGIDYSGDMP